MGAETARSESVEENPEADGSPPGSEPDEEGRDPGNDPEASDTDDRAGPVVGEGAGAEATPDVETAETPSPAPAEPVRRPRPNRPDDPTQGPRRPRSISARRVSDDSVMEEVPVSSDVEVLQAVERGRSVQRAWIGLTAEERFEKLSRLVGVVGEAADDIAELVQAETGKPLVEGLAEVLASVELLKYYDEVAPRILRRQWVKTNWLVGKSAYTYREPFGVVGAITPWNYPFLLVMDAVAPALYTGNAIVVKPSEHTPLSALRVRDLCAEAGLPEGLVQIVPGFARTGETLASSGVDKLFFTGSSATGRRVMASAAASLTPVALELGGKDAAIVLEDADLERAAHGLAFGAFFNAGQTCLSTERVFVVEEVYDEFVEEVVKLAGKLRVGADGEYDVGPLTTDHQLGVVERHVNDAVNRGARALTGGQRSSSHPRGYEPTVLVDVDQSMQVVWEETFGPVLPVLKVRGEDEAIRMVNVSPYGLFASVWTEDRERGERVAERIVAGGVSVNDTLSHYGVPGLPMGGVGQSGFGRRRGVAGLEEMSRPRSVLIHRTGLNRDPWWYPYKKGSLRLVRALLEYRQSSGVKRVWAGIRQLLARGRRR